MVFSIRLVLQVPEARNASRPAVVRSIASRLRKATTIRRRVRAERNVVASALAVAHLAR